jgi:phosphate uptake regulator
METRKLQVSGHSTYILSLPKNWVRANTISKGDRVRLKLQPDGTILLLPSKTEKQRNEISVEVNEADDSLFRKFMGLYLAGYQVINFNLKGDFNGSEKRTIRTMVQKISGLEILDETSESMTIQDLFDSSLFSPEKAIRRMHLLTKTMLKDSVESFLSGDENLRKDVEMRDDDVDLINWLINRQYNLILQDISLSEKLKISPQRGLGFLLMAKAMERIGDHALKISRIEEIHNKGDKQLEEDIRYLTDRMVGNIEDAVSSFFFKNFDDANVVIERVRMVQREIQDLIEKDVMNNEWDSSTNIAHAFLLDSLKCVCSYTIDIAETSINNQYVEE